jgi:steroid 5-alpha reductase family enzyme
MQRVCIREAGTGEPARMPTPGHAPEHPWDPTAAFLTWTWLVLTLAFLLLWWRQRRTRNATSVDAAWSAAIGAVGVVAAAMGDGAPAQRLTAGLLAGGWSLRLTAYLLRHRVFGHADEDRRYRAMRDHWGARADLNFLWFYAAQAIAALLFATPFTLLAAHDSPTLSLLQWAGIAAFLLSQAAEAAADRQLGAWRADPANRGRTCRGGLWRYSRHPNYFFEWTSWCAIGLVTAPAMGWLTAVPPLVMLLLVRFASGVPWNELQARKSRGADYAAYAAQTNTFVPWFPRRASAPTGTES